MGKPKRGDGGIFSGGSILRMSITALMIVIILFAAGVPMMMAAVDRVNLSNLNYALDYWGDRGYVAYADPVGDLNVTGNLDVTGTLTADSINAPTGRTATYVVAASDAPDPVKAQADYVCDGTDDQVEIQAAIDALPSASGGIVQLSTGIFHISAPIAINQVGLIGLHGMGMSRTQIILDANSNCNMINITGTDPNPIWFLSLEDFWLNGNKDNNTTGHGIYITPRVNDSNMRNIMITQMSEHGIYGDGPVTTIGYSVLENLYLEHNDGNGLYLKYSNSNILKNLYLVDDANGLRLDAASNTILDSVYASSCSSSGIMVFRSNGLSLSNFVSRANTGNGINLHESSLLDVSNGIVEKNLQHGFYLYGTSKSTFSNIQVYDNSQETDNTYDGIRLNVGSGTYYSNYNLFNNISIVSDVAAKHKYGLKILGATSSNNIFTNLSIIGSGTLPINNQAINTISVNQGYIAPGEIRTVAIPYVAGNVGAIAASWHNPEAQDIYITKIVVKNSNDATLAATAAIGIADDAAGTNLGAEFFTAIPLNAATGTVFDSYVAGDTGAQTKWIALQDSASATDGWIDMIIADQNSDGTGTIYITYCGQ